jgi:DNA-binding response OmpR family regulator
MSRILVVEDEEHIAAGLAFNLRNAGYEVDVARDGEHALDAVSRRGYDLLLLDVMLPGGKDGFEVARSIRRSGDYTPIVMLTARDLREDRIAGLDAGADDYLVKPFDLDELLARVRGHLRRRAWTRTDPAAAGANGAHAGEPLAALEFGEGCRVDFKSFRARTVDGREVELSQKEAMIMRLFAEREGDVVTRATLLEEVWGEPRSLETRTMDNFILRLRRYFEPEPSNPRHILSVRGAGYRFVK